MNQIPTPAISASPSLYTMAPGRRAVPNALPDAVLNSLPDAVLNRCRMRC